MANHPEGAFSPEATEDKKVIEVEQTPQLTELSEIQGLLHILIAEVRELRRERLPADEKDIRSLLVQIYDLFGSESWTSLWIFDQAADDDPASKRLRAAMSQCLKGKLTIRRLSFFLSKSVGRYGQYYLERCGRSRIGQSYKITVMR